ncbi:hypothetical protein L1987_01388 [Smallanthus sonchifolius]|uniref:Uncharacterized protein n=1 Tax=Smallanthus sonchifolius TaxID=185202 RepID=A0ACB9K564_9ASTR|nr:hypothetical protein L1987_01388 [Smallanthus sonchifolius]
MRVSSSRSIEGIQSEGIKGKQFAGNSGSTKQELANSSAGGLFGKPNQRRRLYSSVTMRDGHVLIQLNRKGPWLAFDGYEHEYKGAATCFRLETKKGGSHKGAVG